MSDTILGTGSHHSHSLKTGEGEMLIKKLSKQSMAEQVVHYTTPGRAIHAVVHINGVAPGKHSERKETVSMR